MCVAVRWGSESGCGAERLRVDFSGTLPGELLGASDGGLPQLGAALRIIHQGGEGVGDRLGSDVAVVDRIPADLGQGRQARRERRSATAHGLENGQTEALRDRGVGQDEASGEETGQVLQRQVAGTQNRQVRGDCRQGRVNVLIPALAAGQNQCGRIGQVRNRCTPGHPGRGTP